MNADPKTLSPAPDADHPAGPGRDEGSGGSAPSKQSPSYHGLHIWLIRIRALLFVTLCATFGVLLLILPWTTKWTDNPLLLNLPALRDVVSSGFARGMASGLGVLDLWLGFWEAIHYHENPVAGG